MPFSIVIPTYKEVNNLADLLAAIAAAPFAGRQFEVILVDDQSEDGSIELMQQLQAQYPWARMIVREGPRSLSRSVMLGCEQATHPFIVSMDADLSHPMHVIPAMLQLLEDQEANMVIGSRYVAGGSVEEHWPLRRKMISKVCAKLTKALLRLTVNDPLSGFFAIRQSTLQRGQITNPSGWKIALEILIKCRCNKAREVAIHFSDRRHGKSKLNARVGIAFFKQLTQLVYFQYLGNPR
jgi:dolichol-phosphate mannosyltransferase